MTSAYFNTRRAPTDLASGRVLAPGEAVDAADLALGEDDDGNVLHDQRLVDEGTLADATVQQPEPELVGDALDQRARELDIPGRSSMSADDLRAAVAEAEVAAAAADGETPPNPDEV